MDWITPEHVIAARREIAERSLVDFVKMAWHVLEPECEYKHGPHIDVIAEHLEAVFRRDIKRLSINVPPGSMKSLLCGVFFPAWVWGPMNQPGARFVGVAHELELAIRDNDKCRTLVSSPWYQNTWGDRVQLSPGQKSKKNFATTAKGYRQVATTSNVTGRRGDYVICDDLLSVKNADSETMRETVNRWYKEALPSRLNDPKKSCIINIMQRLHESDVTSITLADPDYEHVILPMEYDPDSERETSLGPVDWRTEEGELLLPERWGPEEIASFKRHQYSWASQYQQRPAPRDGGLFKPGWFQPIDARPNDIVRTVRAWDLAATKKQATNNPDWTAGVKMSRTASGLFIIEGVNRFRGSAAEVEAAIKTTAASDGKDVTIRIPQDPGQAGKGQAEQMIRMLAGYSVKAERPTGDKATRAAPAAAQAEVGNVRILRTGDKDRDAWIQPFLDEIALFPAGAHDDQIDAMADALNELALGGSGYGVDNLKAWG